MKITINSLSMRIFMPVLGMAVVGLAASGSAQAQGKMKRSKSDGMKSGMGKSGMSDPMMAKDDSIYTDPAPVGYPAAAPGSIGMYHYKSYRSDVLVEGGVTDARMDKEMMRDKKMMMMGNKGMTARDAMKMSYYDDPFMADPAPVNYPQAAPGSLHLYNFSDYTGDKLVPGSAEDKRMEREKMRDQKMMMGNHGMTMRDAMRASYYDNPFMADPASVSYPQAAPGSLQLYSFSDYTGDKLVAGSSTDVKSDRTMMMDKKNMGKGMGKMKKDKMKK